MKKMILVACVAMLATTAFAQISWNVKAGANMSTMTGMENDDDVKMKVGYQVSAGMEYAFTDVWAIQPSLQFITKGFKREGTGYEVTVNPMYLQLPVMAAARVKVSEGMNLVFSAGPYFAYGIGGKATSKQDDEPEEKADVFGDKGAGKRFDCGLGAGVTAEFGKILVGLDSQFGLTKTMKSSGDDKPKNMTIGLSAGYKF